MASRREHGAECVEELDKEFAKRTYEEWKTLLRELDAPWAPVQSVAELLDDPQVSANGYIGDVIIEGEPAYRLPAVPVQFDGRPPPLRRAPEHGEDTEGLLLEAGYGWEEITSLKEAGVVL
jgi:crotonobetainyl-CoA:carnitine CoA-transferase CaiB-like acyl-CoA transferase